MGWFRVRFIRKVYLKYQRLHSPYAGIIHETASSKTGIKDWQKLKDLRENAMERKTINLSNNSYSEIVYFTYSWHI